MPEKSKPDPARLRDKALAYLARREHSRFELTRKLERAGFALGDIEPVLDELEEKEWLSDRRFAESYVAAHRDKVGDIKLFYELRCLGMTDSMAEEVLERNGGKEIERARKVLNKKFQTIPADKREWATQLRFMQQRGFRVDTIHRVLKQPK